MKTVSVSPVDLAIGDRVYAHGAIVEVAHIIVSNKGAHAENGPVHACISRLIGDDHGAIPRGWFDTPASFLARNSGSTWAADLPAGKYWNVQGNRLARVARIIPE